MLLNSFFFIENISHTTEEVRASLRLEKNHSIFNGHFPNQPVVPGVCMMQMVKEILERVEGKRLVIEEAANIKFLSVLDPNQNGFVDSTIAFDEPHGKLMKVTASIHLETTVFFKMKAIFRSV